MSGIAGLHASSTESRERLGEAAERMSHAMAHRGAEASGMTLIDADPGTSGVIYLIHRRLSIIDLSEQAVQPMTTADGRYTIVYDGVIYNYRELRNEFSRNHPQVAFRTHSDTEVILHLFATERETCLNKLRGMFAFAIWDQRTKQLFIARDRFGMKPLYYAFADNAFLFASEIKCLFESGYLDPAIDGASEIAYLQFGSIPSPHTYFKRVKALEPGSYGVLSTGKLQLHSYWSLSGLFEENDGGQVPVRQAAVLVQEALIESVTAHLVSDVPVGIFLSGGINSSAILASARVSHSGPLRTFSIVFPGTPWDESTSAKNAAKYYGTEHQDIAISYKDFCECLDDFFSAMDQPTLDGLSTYFTARAAAKAGFKTALTGIGGNELLGGNSSFIKIRRFRNLTRFVASRYLLFLLTSATRGAETSRFVKLKEMLRKASCSVPEIWAAYRSIFTENQIKSLVSSAEAPRERDPSVAPPEEFRAISFCEISQFLIPELLRDSDIFGMHSGLELRTPFVDHIFLKRVLEIGQWEKGSSFSYKSALFEHLNGFLPFIQKKNKRPGFALPLEVWLSESLNSYAPSGAARISELLNSQEHYSTYISGFLRNRVHWSCIWSLYVLQKFREGVSKNQVKPQMEFA